MGINTRVMGKCEEVSSLRSQRRKATAKDSYIGMCCLLTAIGKCRLSAAIGMCCLLTVIGTCCLDCYRHVLPVICYGWNYISFNQYLSLNSSIWRFTVAPHGRGRQPDANKPGY